MRGGIVFTVMLVLVLFSSTFVYAEEESGFWSFVRSGLESVFKVGGEPMLAPAICADLDGDWFSNDGGDCCGPTLDQVCNVGVDCNDNNAAINPGALDICNNAVDEDCSGTDCTNNCLLRNATWNNKTAELNGSVQRVLPGTLVNLTVYGDSSANCNGQRVSFKIYEVDSSGSLYDDVVLSSPPVNVNFIGDIAVGTWVAQWTNDTDGLDNISEYIYNTTFVNLPSRVIAVPDARRMEIVYAIVCIDADGDGYGDNCALGSDCNDSDPTKWRLADLYADNDHDTYGVLPLVEQYCYGSTVNLASYVSANGLAVNSNDCNDNDATINPNSAEYLFPCDNIDQNCNGQIDEGVFQTCGVGNCTGYQSCTAGVWGACSTYGFDAGTCASCGYNGSIVYNDTQDFDCPSNCTSQYVLSSGICTGLNTCGYSSYDCRSMGNSTSYCNLTTGNINSRTSVYVCSVNQCVFSQENVAETICDMCNDIPPTLVDFAKCSFGDTTCPSVPVIRTDSCAGDILNNYFCSGVDYNVSSSDCNTFDGSNPSCSDSGSTTTITYDDYSCNSGSLSCALIGRTSTNYNDYCSGSNLINYTCSGTNYTNSSFNCNSLDGSNVTCSGVGTSTFTVSVADYDCTTNMCSVIGAGGSGTSCTSSNQCIGSISACSNNYYCYHNGAGFIWNTSLLSSEIGKCADGYNNDCFADGTDYGTASVRGDSDCPVSVSAISVSNLNPVENTNVNVQCTANANNLDAVKARVGTTNCGSASWSGNVANFVCNVGSFGTKDVECYVDSSISYQSGTNQVQQIVVSASVCSAYSQSTTCEGDSSCDWCTSCNGVKYSSNLGDVCVASGSCVYSCVAAQCGAICSDGSTDTVRVCEGSSLVDNTYPCDLNTCNWASTPSASVVVEQCNIAQCGAECVLGSTDTTYSCSVNGTQVLQSVTSCTGGCNWGTPVVTIYDECTVDETCISAQCIPKAEDVYTVNLVQGWNFVSVPLRSLTDSDMDRLSDFVLSYNETNNTWLVNYKTISHQIENVETARGYIVWSSGPRSVVFNGRLDPTINYPLDLTGWNLVGVTRNSNVGDIYGVGQYTVFENIGGSFNDVTLNNLELGKAYWVYPGVAEAPPMLPGFWNFFSYLVERSWQEISG